ncbi:hypothetical protein NPS01_24950 [Nocardioides psychrotolerans]|uniref:S1 family peptidase n=1 Tax=Nocardioides psychrotolerans TaxID=1005945 RepID=UPI000B88EFD2|nr:hypothetical protein NPS01_24950 [Nocardioides psychrotolerans]
MSDLSQAIFALARIGPGGAQPLGTAFACGPRHVVTCLHVTGGDDQNLIIIPPRLSSLSDYQDTTDMSLQPAQVKIVAADPIHDLCVLEVPLEADWSFSYQIMSADAVQPGSPVTTFGFPHADSGRVVLTRQDTTVGARILTGNPQIKSKHLILNVQARPGQSGGPVFDAASGNVVAVLAGSYAAGGGGQISLGGVDPATLHTTTQAISAEYITGMVP